MTRATVAAGLVRPMTGPGDPGKPVIASRRAAAQALAAYFMHNADAGNHALNDEMIVELGRRHRAAAAAGRVRDRRAPGTHLPAEAYTGPIEWPGNPDSLGTLLERTLDGLRRL